MRKSWFAERGVGGWEKFPVCRACKWVAAEPHEDSVKSEKPYVITIGALASGPCPKCAEVDGGPTKSIPVESWLGGRFNHEVPVNPVFVERIARPHFSRSFWRRRWRLTHFEFHEETQKAMSDAADKLIKSITGGA